MVNEKEKIIYVYFNNGIDDILMGRLYISNLRGKEIHAFEYDEKWLSDKKNNIFIDPNINFFAGRQWLSDMSNENNIFGVFEDSAPDRWGRLLLNRREELRAKNENRNARSLMSSDYLLGVSDFTRMGAIRFKFDVDGNFLDDSDIEVPPTTKLRDLEAASLAFENEKNFEEYKILLEPGSSLGGARPKANVIDESGNIYIAKFPSKNDEYDIGALEKQVYDLAKKCNLNVVDSYVMKFSKSGSTFLIKRFDRENENGKMKRIHFESAMALLGKKDGDNSTSYLDIASFIHSYGVNVKNDLKELFKRIAFNIIIKNTDDHLRNHGFLFKNGGWTLSPLYDVNYNKYGSHLHLLIDKNNSSLDTDILVETSKYYDIDKDTGKKIVDEINDIVNNEFYKK